MLKLPHEAGLRPSSEAKGRVLPARGRWDRGGAPGGGGGCVKGAVGLPGRRPWQRAEGFSVVAGGGECEVSPDEGVERAPERG